MSETQQGQLTDNKSRGKKTSIIIIVTVVAASLCLLVILAVLVARRRSRASENTQQLAGMNGKVQVVMQNPCYEDAPEWTENSNYNFPDGSTDAGYADVTGSNGTFPAEYMDPLPERTDGVYNYATYPVPSAEYLDVSPTWRDGESGYLDVSPEKPDGTSSRNADRFPVPGSVSDTMEPLYADSFEPTYVEPPYATSITFGARDQQAAEEPGYEEV